MTSRREFLGAIAASPALFGTGADKPRLLAQVYVFTQELGRRKVPLADGIDEIFATTKDAGYHGIELMSTLFTPQLAERTIESAHKHGIDVPITYCFGAMHTPDRSLKTIQNVLGVAEIAAKAGTVAININPDPIGRPKTDPELATQAAGLNDLGKALRTRGQKLLVHHHNPEMADNAREWRYNLANTDPALVWMCLDTHWMFRGGQQYMTLVREAGGRTGAFHLRNSENGTWLESLGPGDLDYTQLAAYLKQQKLNPWLVVELAYEEKTPHTRPLGENLRMGREYAERIFGVKA